MYEMITDILTMAQLEAGSVEISFDIVELDSIVQSAIAMVHGTGQAKGRTISGHEECHFFPQRSPLDARARYRLTVSTKK